ncbi:MAG: Wzz/FepE/Etk N-terminal domain-containing protein [Glaciecola sp.]
MESIAKGKTSEDFTLVSNNQVDLVQVCKLLWSKKWRVVIVCSLSVVFAVLYALHLPNVYKSQATWAPATSDSQMGAIGGQLGGLASLAGINIAGGGQDQTGIALEVMRSRQFLMNFIEKYNVTAPLMASISWDASTDKLLYDDVYDPEDDMWLKGEDDKPSLQEALKRFNEIYEVEHDKKSGMIFVSISHYSPFLAQAWVNALGHEINQFMKEQDQTEAKVSIEYLSKQIQSTKLADNRALLFQLLEEQEKKLMFTEVRSEYVFKVIDPAIAPERKVGPRRALIVIAWTLLGCFIIVLWIFFEHSFKKSKGTLN